MEQSQIKIVRKTGFFGTLLCIIILLALGMYAYKRAVIDCNGKFASGRLIYSKEYGLCILITYHPEYRNHDAKGFALTSISYKPILNGTIRGSTYRNSTVDSEELLNEYKTLSIYGGSGALTDALLKFVTNSSFTTESFDIDSYGKYFIYSLRDAEF